MYTYCQTPSFVCGCGLRVMSDKHHLPRTCHDIRGQTRTKVTDTIRAIKRLTRDLSVSKLFIDKNPRRSTRHPKLPPCSAPRVVVSTHPPDLARHARRACEPSPHPPPRRADLGSFTLPPGGDSPAPSPMRTPAMLRWAAALAVLLAVAAPAAGFYLPGVAPNDFAKVCWVPAVSLPSLVHLGVIV